MDASKLSRIGWSPARIRAGCGPREQVGPREAKSYLAETFMIGGEALLDLGQTIVTLVKPVEGRLRCDGLGK